MDRFAPDQTKPTGASTRAMWVTLLLSPAIYSVYFMVGYFLVEFACEFNWLQFSVLGLRAMVWILLVLSALTLAGIVYACLRGYRTWQRNRQATDLAGVSARFMGLAGLLLAVLFGVATVISGIVSVVLAPCPWI